MAATNSSIVIVGAGFGGLCMAIALRKQGFDDFLILDKGAQVGGTWRDNTYPGCACDVPSLMYAYSFEPNPQWSRSFSGHTEIWQYTRHCFAKYDIDRFVRCNQNVTQTRYDDATGRWYIATQQGDTYLARAVVMATGGLSQPSVPTLPGLANFVGTTFHSANWDHSYDLRGKRVAVIGTGASAIQFVPQIAPLVGQLDLYQRTPPWVMAKPDRAITKLEQWLYAKLPAVQALARCAVYCILESRAWAFFWQPRALAVAAFGAKRHLHKQVPDAALRAKLLPNYTIGCKRILLSNDYYPALTRPNVHLVTDGIAQVEANGIRDRQGLLRPADALIFGTGFETQQPVLAGQVIGRDGLDLALAWQNGPEAYKGTVVAGFPNAFFVVGPNTGLGHNSMIYMIESQAAYIADAVRLLRQTDFAPITVSAAAQAQYNQGLQARMATAVWQTGCQSWYINAAGKNTTLWPGFTFAFRRQTKFFDRAAFEVVPRVT